MTQAEACKLYNIYVVATVARECVCISHRGIMRAIFGKFMHLT